MLTIEYFHPVLKISKISSIVYRYIFDNIYSNYINHVSIRIRAIHEAIRDNDELTLKQLMDNKKFANARDVHGRTPLHIALLFNRENIITYLLLVYRDCVNEVDKVD